MFQSKQEKGLFTFYRQQAEQQQEQEQDDKTFKKVQKKSKPQIFQKFLQASLKTEDFLSQRKKIYPLKKSYIQKEVLQQISQHEEHKIIKSARSRAQYEEHYAQQNIKKSLRLQTLAQNKMHKAFQQNKQIEEITSIKSKILKKANSNLRQHKHIRSLQLSRNQSQQLLPKSERRRYSVADSNQLQLQAQLPSIHKSSMGKYLIPKVKIKSNLISKALKQNDTQHIRKMRQYLREQIQREKEFILHHLRVQKFHNKKTQNQQAQPQSFIGRHRKLLSILKFKVIPK